jgi:hypothetical protein
MTELLDGANSVLTPSDACRQTAKCREVKLPACICRVPPSGHTPQGSRWRNSTVPILSPQTTLALSVSINELRSARLRITQTVSTATELEAQVNE